MNDQTELLNDLIEIARDGEQFYLDAAGKVPHVEIQKTFREMAAVRSSLIRDLAQHVTVRGEKPSQDGTVIGWTRKAYAEILAAVSDDREGIYIAQLEETEDRLLEHFRATLNKAEAAQVREVLQRHLPAVKAAHDRMRLLAKISKAA